MKPFLTIFLTFIAMIAIAVQGTAGPYRIDLRTDPDVVPVGRAKVLLTITDSSGKPVSGATVKVLVQMPGMPMGEREETATPGAAPGSYSAPAVFGMAGSYGAQISVSGPLGSGKATLGLTTGEGAESGSGLRFGAVVIGILLVTGALLVIRQVRKTGQKFAWRSLLSRQVVVPILLLGGALAVAVSAVNTFRRPGSMTPLEAQVMDMNAPAPIGTLPVRLATAETKPFGTTVTYTGQAVGYVEQQVVPRVSGVIVWMPFYVGNKVAKGQLLARLDTSQIDPMVGEKIAGVDVAAQGVDVAAMEYQQALNMVTQARAEVSMAQGELAEAKSMLDAAQQGRGSSEALVTSAQADVAAMRAELRSAEADAEYQDQELQRMKALFDKEAISKDEWQRAQADDRKARADVDKAREGVNRAQAGVTSARAELKKTDAEISAARRKVQQADAQVRAKQAAVTTAQSAAAAAKAKIGQSRSSVAQASAGLRSATTERSYTELRSEVDGVVTDRVISPGVLVSPGQTILKVSEVSPIRLQANVPEADLARIREGAAVKVKLRDGHDEPLTLRITSISPSVDPSSRIGMVEALYSNGDGRFRPGQYLSMEIAIGGDKPNVVVPSDAVQTEEGKSYVWVAEPAMNNQFTVSRHEIQLAGEAGDLVAVKSGIASGQQVVVAPPQGLTAGTSVAAVMEATGAPALSEQTIEITAAGYNPPSINVPAGKAFRVTFIRRDDKTCGTEVIFPDLRIRKTLPLNQPVTIEIPPQPAGKELNFTCPMNMLKGQAVAK
ncbi:MAG TPA: efflux RND transporter periplasmic adaptor subunit [Fimbriimonadaceae bacterium]|nr:efflux RND transporter periplasmic adaptor subunit [Fimbriimonadaceae bacterium]